MRTCVLCCWEAGSVSTMPCLELEGELRETRQRLGAAGLAVTYSAGADPTVDVNAKLKRWLAV
jgi:hypothetical protein